MAAATKQLSGLLSSPLGANAGRPRELRRGGLQDTAELLPDTTPDLLVDIAFPWDAWKACWSASLRERLSREVARRVDLVGVFPGDAGATHLIGAVLGMRPVAASCHPDG